MNMGQSHLDRLLAILPKENLLFPCIKDLVSNGVSSRYFQEELSGPNRQEITQFLVKWFLYLDIDQETCLQWMIPFCQEVLSWMSSSSFSQIRHSTKSNVKYIYKNCVSFECQCEGNILYAECRTDCPVYEKMKKKMTTKKKEEDRQNYFENPAVEIPDENKVEPVKNKFKDQFQEGLAFAQEKLSKGGSKKRVAQLMNNKGYKTRTGKRWTASTLSNEINKIKKE